MVQCGNLDRGRRHALGRELPGFGGRGGSPRIEVPLDVSRRDRELSLPASCQHGSLHPNHSLVTKVSSAGALGDQEKGPCRDG